MRLFYARNERLELSAHECEWLTAQQRLQLMPIAEHETEIASESRHVDEKRRATVCVDLDDAATLAALCGPVEVRLRDASGRCVGVGRTIAVARLATNGGAQHERGAIASGWLNFNANSEAPKARIFDDAAASRSSESSKAADEPMDVASSSTEATAPIATKETVASDVTATAASKAASSSIRSRETFVVVGRDGERFRLAPYNGPLPPKETGTYVTNTTLVDGLMLRTVRTYDRDLHNDVATAVSTRREIVARIDEAAAAAAAAEEAAHESAMAAAASASPGYSLLYGSDGGGSSSATEDASVAHLQIANALMLEAQSLGLDRPSNVVVPLSAAASNAAQLRASNSAEASRRRASSGVSASDFAQLNMSDSEVSDRAERFSMKGA